MENKLFFTAGYKILPEMELVIDARFGTVSVEGLLAFKKQLEEEPFYNKDYFSIVDTREMDWGIVVSDVSSYVQALAGMKGGVSPIKKAAGIYSSIHQLAYTQIVHQEFKKVNQPQKFFNELGPAIEWLGKPITVHEVEMIIKEIKENPQFVWKQ